ncbi:MAG TPA: ankyrin repeat domain-containing protein, partial [Methylomirabilota bacterium]|nr:ankyrin repeat domain-containing protein [Methylomirabilota bacterium]
MKPFHLSIPSRRLPAACLIAFLIAPLQPFGAETNGLAAALQKGLFEEEANRNLGEAIKAYQAATALFDQDRKLAATAIFRLAECYRKQGNTNEALAQYQRVVGEFGDQSEVNTPARQALLALGGASTPTAAAAGPGATQKEEADEIARIAEMIRNSPDLINAKGQGGMRPLYQAACKGQVGVAQYLLDHGAEVNSGSADSGALQCAALNGHRAMVELLLSRKADVNATDNLGATALHLAARQGFRTVVETLLAHGAEVDARDNSGETPLHYAAAGGNKGVIELLLDHKAEVNAKSEGGATPLLLAVSKKEVESAKALLAHKADPNLPGNVTLDGTLLRGYYPVHVAVKARNDELLDLLLKNGAKPNTMTTESERPLNLAVSLKRKS